MKVIICDNVYREKWDNFVKENSLDFGLLQSWPWGEFVKNTRGHQADAENESVNNKAIIRLALKEDSGNFLAVAQIIKQKLPLGKCYFYLPRGPITDKVIVEDQRNEIIEFLFSEIKKIAEQEKAIFLRLDPSWLDGAENQEILKRFGLIFSGQVQPKQTLILNLKLTEVELSAQMKPKTRYNIKVAQKHCLKIDEGPGYFDDFWRLMQKTSERDQFLSHPQKYYRIMLDILSKEGIIKLIIAKDVDKVIAANLVIFFGDWCVYLHGASDYNYRDKMAPYLLQWETILTAQSKNCRFYDFWGVNETRWPGVTRFKQGFSASTEFTNYVGSWDQVYQPFWYKIYNFLRRK